MTSQAVGMSTGYAGTCRVLIGAAVLGRWHVAALLAVLLMGCGRAAAPPNGAAGTVTSAGGSPGSGTPGAAQASVPKTLLDQVTSDAAAKTKVSAAQVRVVSAQRVDWPDSSLGCPQPGQFYSQIVTPGYRITVEASSVRSPGRPLEYHTDLTSRFVVC